MSVPLELVTPPWSFSPPKRQERDGRWGELAFMQHSTIPFMLEARTVFVPAYPSLSDALALEEVARRMMLLGVKWL